SSGLMGRRLELVRLKRDVIARCAPRGAKAREDSGRVLQTEDGSDRRTRKRMGKHAARIAQHEPGTVSERGGQVLHLHPPFRLPTIRPPTTYILCRCTCSIASMLAFPTERPCSRFIFLARARRNSKSLSRMFSMPRKT